MSGNRPRRLQYPSPRINGRRDTSPSSRPPAVALIVVRSSGDALDWTRPYLNWTKDFHMIRTFLAKTLTAMLVGVFAISLASPAQADFTLSITDLGPGGGTFSTKTASGSLVGSTILDGYTINYNLTSSRPTQSPTDAAVIAAHTTISGNAGASTARFNIIVQDNFTFPGTVGSNVFLSADLAVAALTAAGPVTDRAQYQPSNNGNPVGGNASIVKTETLTATTAPTTLASTQHAITRTNNSFSLTGVEFVTLQGAGSFADLTGTSIVAMPAPGALVMVLCGMPAFGAIVWGRRKKARSEAK